MDNRSNMNNNNSKMHLRTKGGKRNKAICNVKGTKRHKEQKREQLECD